MIDPQLDQPTLRAHHTNIAVVAKLINVTSAYLAAPDGSGAEEVSEFELEEAMKDASRMSPEQVGNALLALCSLISAVAEPEDVQAWFDHQSRMIAEALE